MNTPNGENPILYVMKRDLSEIKAAQSNSRAFYVSFFTVRAMKKGRPYGRPSSETLSLISLSNRPKQVLEREAMVNLVKRQR